MNVSFAIFVKLCIFRFISLVLSRQTISFSFEDDCIQIKYGLAERSEFSILWRREESKIAVLKKNER
jgi:hypothetical protein